MLIRLAGIRFTRLIPGNYQIKLYEDTQEMISLYQSIDSIKKRYGEQSLMRATGVRQPATGKHAARSGRPPTGLRQPPAGKHAAGRGHLPAVKKA